MDGFPVPPLREVEPDKEADGEREDRRHQRGQRQRLLRVDGDGLGGHGVTAEAGRGLHGLGAVELVRGVEGT